MTEDCWHDELVKELYEVLDKWIDEREGAAEVMNTVIHTLAESI